MKQELMERLKQTKRVGLSGRPVKLPKDTADAENRPKPNPPPAGRVKAYFDASKGAYYALNSNHEYQIFPGETIKLLLRHNGFLKGYNHANGLSYLEAELLRIATEDTVHYAGPLGGFDVGMYELCGFRVLVTRAAKFLQPVAGDFPLFKKFLRELLGEQVKYFCAWVKWALQSLRNGLDWSPGQLLAIAGPPGSGKSLLQTLLTPILGGRISSPYDFMTGKETKNAEIFGAEHGLIGDQNHKTDYASRRAFGSAIKTLVVNREQKVRGMFKEGLTLMPFLRLTLTLNDNPESLLVLPPLDSDVSDKILLLRAAKATFPFPSKAFPTEQIYKQALERELPHFLFWLRSWKIPESIRDQRYGVFSYHDDGLVENLHELSPEIRLWQLIETYLFTGDFCGEWEGTSSDLQALLEDRCKGRETRTVLPYSSACGQYLGKLHKQFEKEARAAGEGWVPAIEMRKAGKNRHVYKIRRDMVKAPI